MYSRASKAARRSSSCTKSVLPSLARQAQVGIVGAQRNPVLGPRGEHAVGFGRAARHEIVNQHANVAFVASNDKGNGSLFTGGRGRGRPTRIGSGDNALRGRFLVARGAADLTRQVQSANLFGFQRVRQTDGVDEIVFHVVTRAHNFHGAQTLHGAQNLLLNLLGIRAAHAVGVDQVRVQPFGFEKAIVPQPFRKALHLFVNGRTVARSVALALEAVVNGQRVFVLHHQLVRFLVGGRLKAVNDLIGRHAGRLLFAKLQQVRKGLRGPFRRLHRAGGPVNGLSVDPRGRARFQAREGKFETGQRFRQPRAGRFDLLGIAQVPSPGVALVAQHEHAAEKGARGDNDGAGEEFPLLFVAVAIR